MWGIFHGPPAPAQIHFKSLSNLISVVELLKDGIWRKDHHHGLSAGTSWTPGSGRQEEGWRGGCQVPAFTCYGTSLANLSGTTVARTHQARPALGPLHVLFPDSETPPRAPSSPGLSLLVPQVLAPQSAPRSQELSCRPCSLPPIPLLCFLPAFSLPEMICSTCLSPVSLRQRLPSWLSIAIFPFFLKRTGAPKFIWDHYCLTKGLHFSASLAARYGFVTKF